MQLKLVSIENRVEPLDREEEPMHQVKTQRFNHLCHSYRGVGINHSWMA